MTTQTVFDQALEALAILRVNRTVQLSHSAESKVADAVSALLAAKQAAVDASPSPVSVQPSKGAAEMREILAHAIERSCVTAAGAAELVRGMDLSCFSDPQLCSVTLTKQGSMCEVLLNFGGEDLPVIQDNGDTINHTVPRGGIEGVRRSAMNRDSKQAKPIAKISADQLAILQQENNPEPPGQHVRVWHTENPPSRAIISLYEQPAQPISSDAQPVAPAKWREYMKHKSDCLGGLSGNKHACVCGLEAILSASPAPAVSSQAQPDAWLYVCTAPGKRTVYASVDQNDTNHWPLDQWTSIEKIPLRIPAPDVRPYDSLESFEKVVNGMYSAPDVRPSVPADQQIPSLHSPEITFGTHEYPPPAAPQMLTFDNGMQLPIVQDGGGFKIHPDYLEVSMTDDTKTLAAYRTLIHTHHPEPDGSEFGFCRVKFDERGQLVSALWAGHEEIDAAVAALLSTQPASVLSDDLTKAKNEIAELKSYLDLVAPEDGFTEAVVLSINQAQRIQETVFILSNMVESTQQHGESSRQRVAEAAKALCKKQPVPSQPASVSAPDSEGTSEFDKGWLAGLAAATGPEMESPSVLAVAGQEPAEYQRRMRPTWRADGEGWTEWERCSKGSYDDVLRLKIYKDWQYEARALYAAPSAPSVSAPVEMETGWLVENGKQGDELRYRTMESGLPEWTADPNKAIRFARRIDAEWFAQEDEDAWAIVQHAWHDLAAASAPSVSADAKESERDRTIRQAVVYHNGQWPQELYSGVMFFKGERITENQFKNAIAAQSNKGGAA